MKKNRRRKYTEAELDITAFMILMIVLVPVLLLGLVFSQVTAIDVNLPEGTVDRADDMIITTLASLLYRKIG